MRKAPIYNFLLEATIIASIAIMLLLVIRKLFRKQLGSRTLCFAWLIVAIRLLCPLSLPNPLINEIRPPRSDIAIRPIAGQIQRRFSDMMGDLDRLRYRYDWDREGILAKSINNVENAIYDGSLAETLMVIYMIGIVALVGWFIFRNLRFRYMLKTGRVETLSGKVQMEYHQLCVKRKVCPLPVYYTDPLPSACLVGVFQPYIALPLTSKPNETIHVLDHEICHFKGWDHIWGLVRLLCCIVHWFNPLVWLAAHLSMTDCELACDERVTKDLNEEERKEYAGILVLAAARRNAPGLPVLATGMTMTGKRLRERIRSIVQNPKTIRWLACSFAVCTCLLLVFAFGTSEYHPSVRFSAAFADNDAIYQPAAVENSDAALIRATEVWQSPYLISESIGQDWCVSKELGGYIIQSRSSDGDPMTEMIMLPDGTVVSFCNILDRPGYASTPANNRMTDEGWEELADYLLRFMDAVTPGHSNAVEAFDNGEAYEQNGVLYASMKGLTLSPLGLENGYSFWVKLTDDAPRLVSFQMEQPVLARLWQNGMTDHSSPNAHRMNGLLTRAYTEADGTGTITKPSGSVYSAEEALRLAMTAICERYGETSETLRRFEVRYKYTAEGDPHMWRFDFSYITPMDMYSVYLDAKTGEIISITGRDEGNG